jgi:hypothetical protein
MVPALQRHACPADPRRPRVLAAFRRIRPRRNRRRADRARDGDAARGARIRAGSLWRRPTERAGGRIRAARVGGLPIAPAWSARRVRRRPGRPGRGYPERAARNGVRAGADDRLPDALPVFRRGTHARAVVASGLSPQLQPRDIEKRGIARSSGRPLGCAARGRPARAQWMRGRVIARHPVQRPAVRPGAHTAGGASGPG